MAGNYNEEPLYKWFSSSHLPQGPLRATSEEFEHLARVVINTLTPCQQRTMALEHLLVAKDAAVRARLETERLV